MAADNHADKTFGNRELTDLKENVSSRVLTNNLLSLVGGAMVLGALAVASIGGPLALAAGAALGLGGAALSYVTLKRQTELTVDMEELEAQRNARNLARAFKEEGLAAAPETLAAVATHQKGANEQKWKEFLEGQEKGGRSLG